jgi:hypothetical protein
LVNRQKRFVAGLSPRGEKAASGDRNIQTFNIQHSTFNIQHSTFNIQHSTPNVEGGETKREALGMVGRIGYHYSHHPSEAMTNIKSIFAMAVAAGVAQGADQFHVVAFYTGQNDLAHISFVREANEWFPKLAATNGFTYTATTNWDNLKADFLTQYQVVMFLDTRPDKAEQRAAFQQYIEHGGAWMGFHFAGFALTPSAYPQNWDWYHNVFLGSGEYVGNTWRPTSAILRVEAVQPATRHLPATFSSAPNEWYRWKNDLRKNPDIKVLLSIDPRSFPLGTGPKPNEIWHEGDYPVVWTNLRYKMVYFNMGHNDMDYEHKFDNTNRTLSYTFANETQRQLMLEALLWLGGAKAE